MNNDIEQEAQDIADNICPLPDILSANMMNQRAGYVKVARQAALEALRTREGFVLLNVQELRDLTFSFDSRAKLESMINAIGEADEVQN